MSIAPNLASYALSVAPSIMARRLAVYGVITTRSAISTFTLLCSMFQAWFRPKSIIISSRPPTTLVAFT